MAARPALVLGWLAWLAYQLASAVVLLLGALALVPLAVFELWVARASRLAMFAGRQVNVWLPWPAAVFGFMAGAVLGLPVSHGASVALASSGAIAGIFGAWDNDEDGVDGAAWYKAEHAGRPAWLNAYLWGMRNSGNGLRRLPGAALELAGPPRVRLYPWGYVATYGWRQCVQWRRLRFGWLISRDAGAGCRAWPVLELV